MNYGQLLKQIQEKPLAPLYFFYGEEPYFIDSLSDAIVEIALASHERDFNLHILYGKETDVQTVIDHATRYPMMAQRQVVIVREAQHLQRIADLGRYVEQPTPSTVLVVHYKHKRLDKRTALAKVLAKNGVLFEAKKLYDNQLPNWISQQVKQTGASITGNAANLMAEYVGADLSRLQKELDKLMLHVDQDRSISVELVEDLIGISKDYNLFELQRALSVRKTDMVYRIVLHFVQNMKQHPLVMIVASLYHYFSKVYIMHSVLHASQAEQQKALNLHAAFFLNEYRQAARNYRVSQLHRIFGILHRYDLLAKGVGHAHISDEENLKQMIAEILAA